MLLLAVSFYALFYVVDPRRPAAGFILLAVFILLLSIVILGLADLRLTWKLRRHQRS
jgi:Tfp pilus assembly protein PilX